MKRGKVFIVFLCTFIITFIIVGEHKRDLHSNFSVRKFIRADYALQVVNIPIMTQTRPSTTKRHSSTSSQDFTDLEPEIIATSATSDTNSDANETASRAEKRPLESIVYEDSKVALVILLKDQSNFKEYEFAQRTVRCYAQSRNLSYYVITNNEQNTESCAQTDYMYQRHCVLAKFMATTKHEWFVMLDADMGVVNPNNTIATFIPEDNSTFLVLTNRVMNDEIMSGSYIVRNNAEGRAFLNGWAMSFFNYTTRFGSDNAAIHSVLFLLYRNDLIEQVTRCEWWWERTRSYCRLFLYEACMRKLIENTTFPGIKFIPKGLSYVRDGWLTEQKYGDRDLFFHNWKESMTQDRKRFGFWKYQFENFAFNDENLCSTDQAKSQWRIKSGFKVSEQEISRQMETWTMKTKKLHEAKLRVSETFLLNSAGSHCF